MIVRVSHPLVGDYRNVGSASQEYMGAPPRQADKTLAPSYISSGGEIA